MRGGCDRQAGSEVRECPGDTKDDAAGGGGGAGPARQHSGLPRGQDACLQPVLECCRCCSVVEGGEAHESTYPDSSSSSVSKEGPHYWCRCTDHHW